MTQIKETKNKKKNIKKKKQANIQTNKKDKKDKIHSMKNEDNYSETTSQFFVPRWGIGLEKRKV